MRSTKKIGDRECAVCVCVGGVLPKQRGCGGGQTWITMPCTACPWPRIGVEPPELCSTVTSVNERALGLGLCAGAQIGKPRVGLGHRAEASQCPVEFLVGAEGEKALSEPAHGRPEVLG